MKANAPPTGTEDRLELAMRFAYWYDQHRVAPGIDAIRHRFNLSRAAAYRWRHAAQRAKGVPSP